MKTTSGYDPKPRARYRYNALGMRALVERDADTTDNAQSINERRYLYYNAAWQIVEEHVDAGFASAFDPVSIDRIVQNFWGLRYIDNLVLRRVDANYPGSGLPSFSQTAAGDIDWEQYLTDHQFSVVAAVGRTGTLAFRVAYDAYGEARHLPAKDINGDGKVDSADTAIAQNASGKKLGTAGYNPDADWDRDGIVTSTDIAQFGSRSYIAALPQGQLAQPGGAVQPAAGDTSPTADLARAANARSDFNIGFSGYRFNGDIGAYTVRFRHYDPTPGMARWVERDPVGSAGGGNPYSYRTVSTVWEPQPYGIAPPDEEPRRYGKRPPGKPIPPPGHTLTRGTVSADSAAGRYIACEDARIAKLRHPLAGTFTNNWHGRSWLEETWDTVRHMDPHEVLDAAGMLPVVGTLADLVNAGLYLVEGRYGEAGLSLGAAVPGIGDFGAAGKVIHRAAKWGACDVLNIACFTAGTVVLTPQGPVPIESILPGDEVVSVDAETGAPVVAKVLGVSRGIAAEPCTQVTVDAGKRGAEGFGAEGFGAHGLETFTATDGHPFLVLSGERLDLRGDAEHVPLYEPLGTPRGRWVRAAELLPGDTVATRSGSATVVRVAPHARPEVVYNLHVEGTARYLVGACGVVVHNSPCSEAAEGGGRALNKLRPDTSAVGAHTTFRVDPSSGRVTHYETWHPQTNPRNPNRWESAKRYDGVGGAHFNKSTGADVPTPHVHDRTTPGGVRPPLPDEVPR